MIKKNFNSLTPENVMNGIDTPSRDKYFWDDADKIVDLHRKWMKVPGTLFAGMDRPEPGCLKIHRKQVTKEVALARLKIILPSRFKV